MKVSVVAVVLGVEISVDVDVEGVVGLTVTYLIMKMQFPATMDILEDIIDLQMMEMLEGLVKGAASVVVSVVVVVSTMGKMLMVNAHLDECLIVTAGLDVGRLQVLLSTAYIIIASADFVKSTYIFFLLLI